MGNYVINKSSNGQYYFVLKASNGQVLVTSETYTTKSNCKNGISSVKINGKYDANYTRLISNNEQYYFVIKSSANGQVLATSETYVTSQSRESGIASCKLNIDSQIIDLT
ncbi:MAG: YegP family protein [Bacillus sp. (in: firmicutes)]